MNQPTKIWKKPDSKQTIASEKQASLTIIKGSPLGEIFILDSEEVLGRCNGSTIILTDISISRRHLLIQKKDGHFIATDLNSTNGTEINDKKITDASQLMDGDKIRIADTVLKFSFHDSEEALYHQQVRTLIIKDDLTKIYNKRYFSETIEKEFNFAKRNKSSLSLILFDIDHFKLFNDQYGHQAGDFVLTEIAALINPLARNYDTFARFGGEEFAVLLRDTELSDAVLLANRMRQLVANSKFNYKDQDLQSSISLGVATYNAFNNFKDQHQLISIADHYLYEAKHTGRNRVCYDSI
ncbi:MAG: diguanylate cyclase [Methylomarinum sp.]|nr:diguanylate cyclase [Methylomarinum sp.]